MYSNTETTLHPSQRLSGEDNIIVSANNISKIYQLYERPENRLKQFVYPRLQRILGRRPQRYYWEFWALKNVSLDVKKGETVGIIGRNGSGKSTLLQVIAGTLSQTHGDVETRGRIAALLELGSGFNPEFTGRENIYLNAAILGLHREEIDAQYNDIVAFADIGSFIDQPIKTYSSGMVIRVAFATAIHVNPDLLIVDEALAVGDIAFQQKCYGHIREMQKRGVSILLVTHSNNVMVEYCDRGIFLKDGKVVFDGSSREASQAYGEDILADEGGHLNKDHSPSVLTRNHDEQAVHGGSSETKSLDIPNDLAMEIKSVKFLDVDERETIVFPYNAIINVDVVVTVRNFVEQPTFGIQISNTEGIVLWGITTQMMDVQLDALSPGNYRIRWQLRANFLGNRYVVAVGVGKFEKNEYKRLNAMPYAGYFDVLPVKNSGFGWLHPQVKILQPIEPY